MTDKTDDADIIEIIEEISHIPPMMFLLAIGVGVIAGVILWDLYQQRSKLFPTPRLVPQDENPS